MPVLESLLILGHDLLVLFELVPHLNLDAAGFIEFGSLFIKLRLQCLQFVLLQLKCL